MGGDEMMRAAKYEADRLLNRDIPERDRLILSFFSGVQLACNIVSSKMKASEALAKAIKDSK